MLSAEASDALAGEVERAAEWAIQFSSSAEAPIAVAFNGDESALTVVIACDRHPAALQPDSSSADGISVHWQSEGSRLTCQIRQATHA